MAARVELINVTPEYLLQGEVSIEDLHRLVKRTLALPNFWEALARMMKFKKTDFFIDLISISRVQGSSEFISSLFKSNTSHCVSLVNKIIKVSAYMLSQRLLNHEDIKASLFVHEMIARKHLHKFPARKDLIMKAMRQINKVMGERLVELWLTESSRTLIDPEFITAYEFLFLVANAKDRLKLMDKLPRCERTVKPNKKSKLFTIDPAAKVKLTPDSILQDNLNHEIEMQKNLTRPETEYSKPLKYADERLKALEEALSSTTHRRRTAYGYEQKMHEEIWAVLEDGMRLVTKKKSSFTSDSIHRLIGQVIPVSARPSTAVDQNLRRQKSFGNKRVLAHRSFILSDPFCD